MKKPSSQPLLFGVFAITLALLPFELPIAEGVHGVFQGILGGYYPVLFVGSLLLCVSVLLLVVRMNYSCSRFGLFLYFFLSLIFVTIGVLALFVTAVAGINLDLAVQQLMFGFVTPVVVCLVIASLDELQQRKAWIAFYLGWALFLAGSLPFLFISYREAIAQLPGFAEATFGQQLIMWRFTFAESWNWYAQYIGNANKTSNNLLFFLLLSGFLLGNKGRLLHGFPRFLFITVWVLGIFTLLILFSRAALLLLPIALYVADVPRVVGRRVVWLFLVTLSLSVVVGYTYYSDAFIYLVSGEYMGEETVGALGTMYERFVQWSEIWSFMASNPEVLLFGMGTGVYGESFFGDAIAGAHNTFVDTLLESGMSGLLTLVILVLLMFFVAALKWTRERTAIPLVCTLVLVMLMMREHSFSYLYVTSLGGFCFATLFYLLASRSLWLFGFSKSPTQRSYETQRVPFVRQSPKYS